MKKMLRSIIVILLVFTAIGCSAEKKTDAADSPEEQASNIEETTDTFPIGMWVPESGSLDFSFELQEGGKGIFFLHGKDDGRLAEWVLANDTLVINFSHTDGNTYHYEYKVVEEDGVKKLQNTSKYATEDYMVLEG